jgi:hypothetical protein
MDSDLSQIPAQTPPPGVISNFVNPVSSSPACRIVIFITLPLMIFFLALRVYVRQYRARAASADDGKSEPLYTSFDD